jgi:hypothetical protein
VPVGAAGGELMHYKIGETFYLYPEFCSHDFFHGWHLYERDRNDGSRNDDGDWGWIRSSSMRASDVQKFCREFLHLDMPTDYEKFVDEFARRFPRGIPVILGEYQRYFPVIPLVGVA